MADVTSLSRRAAPGPGRRRLPLAALAALLVVACGDEVDVSGIWDNENDPVQITLAGYEGPRYLEGTYPRLVLGQYGKEVAGVFKAYGSSSRGVPYLWCSIVLAGGLSGDTLTFSFDAYAPGAPTAQMVATLTSSTDGDRPALTGWIKLAGGDENYAPLTLTGQAIERISDDYKRCTVGPPPPTDAGGAGGQESGADVRAGATGDTGSADPDQDQDAGDVPGDL